jgi:hypothetical protein
VRRLAAVAAGVLLLPGGALAHVIPAPAFAPAGEPTTVGFTVKNEREGHVTVALELTPPPGVELRPEAPPPGWSASVQGSSVHWTGGRISGSRTLAFATRVTATTRAGLTSFRAVQRYEDGGEVRWEAPFTVLPAVGANAPSEHLGRAIAAGVAGLVVVVGTLAGLHLLRRRRGRAR